MRADVQVIRPNQGPQEAFLSTPADIAIYGGAANAGKSFALLLDPLRHVRRPGFTAIVFRREATRLVGGGSLWAESQLTYPATGARSRETPSLEWTWGSGARLEMRHLQYAKDVHAHQGKQYAGIYFDEICEFEESQFWYLISRLRTTCGIRPYVRATCNPDPDSFVRRLIDWWIDEDGFPIRERSGVLRWFVRDGGDLIWFDSQEASRAAYPDREALSLTFIPAKLTDNPKGDPTYRDKLLSLPYVERAQLLDGNWNVRNEAGSYFKRDWFDVVDRAPDDVVRWVRAWDLAATEESPGKDPDWTRGALVGVTRPRADGRPRIVIADIAGIRALSGTVERFYVATARQDGHGVEQLFWQDPGQAGKDQIRHIRDALAGYAVSSQPATQKKQAYAKLWSAKAEPRNGALVGDVILVRGEWNAAFLAEAQAFDGGAHDDMIDAVSRANIELEKATPVRSFRVRGI